MEVALEVFVLVGAWFSRSSPATALSAPRALAARVGAPPFVVGVALVAVGTDLPEIANSIVSPTH